MFNILSNLICDRKTFKTYRAGYITEQLFQASNSFLSLRFSPYKDMLLEIDPTSGRVLIIDAEAFRIELFENEWELKDIDAGKISTVLVFANRKFPNYGIIKIILKKI